MSFKGSKEGVELAANDGVDNSGDGDGNGKYDDNCDDGGDKRP